MAPSRRGGPAAERCLSHRQRAVSRAGRESSRESLSRGHGGRTGEPHHSHLARDGRETPIDDSAAPIRVAGESPEGVVLVFRDITTRRLAEQIVQEGNRRKDEFLAILSHELRNPLAPISMAVSMLGRVGPPTPELQQLRDIIERQMRQLTRLLDDLMDVSRIALGKISLQKVRVSIAAAVMAAIEAVRPFIDAQNHELLVEGPDEALEVSGDLGRLSQIFANLLGNAAKYTRKGGRISVRIERDGAEAVVRIR